MIGALVGFLLGWLAGRVWQYFRALRRRRQWLAGEITLDG